MIDVKAIIQQEKLEKKRNYILITEFLDLIKRDNPKCNFSEIIDCLFIKLKENNPRTITHNFKYRDFEDITVYVLPEEIGENAIETSRCFFEILADIKKHFLVAYSLLDYSDDKKAINFISENNKDFFISKPQIERLLSVKLDKEKSKQEQEETLDLQKEIAIAKKRIIELETILQSKEEQAEKVNFNAVDYDQFSIYGHTSENLNIVFEVIKKLASKVDKDNPHSYPTKEELKAFIKRYFSDNEKLAEAIYQIIIPENVKTRGRTPQGVETFQGFN